MILLVFIGAFFITNALAQEPPLTVQRIHIEFPPVLLAIEQAVDPVDPAVKRVRVDYAGIGSDFERGVGLTDCIAGADFPAIPAEQVKRGYNQEEGNKIRGRHFLRSPGRWKKQQDRNKMDQPHGLPA